eukprot:TRINITY_DN1477_c0_g1_i1.p1 TRINITY_DN1477_c0_g1~~TRINITY_DN1477_c0_g1_i1.p1  ORF type:complete len:509 (+),score=115.96 TRINITY_DN1477_c0_g1_i1:157-1527(+)
MENAKTCVDLDTGDTAWMIMASVLVLGMIPGLSIFEAGLLRSKNTISVMIQVVAGVSVLSVMWVVVGFSIVFGDTFHGIIGNPATFPLMQNLANVCLPRAPLIPAMVFGAFQTMFASITPLLMTGAFAGRLRFKAYMLFIILWEILVYYPLAHWIWGGGWMSLNGDVFHGKAGVLDFAGGIVIHTSAGIGALVCAVVLGPRVDFAANNGKYEPSNIPLALVGACLLWSGWFGFNAGSSFAASLLSTTVIVNTHVSACVSGVVWLILSMIRVGKAELVEVVNGVIAGLALITPASGYIEVYSSLGLSVVGGVTSFFGVILLKEKLKIDDALDVCVVHGFTGLLGSLAIGFLATTDVNTSGVDGLFYGRPIQLLMQLLGIGVTLVWAGVWTYLILKLVGLITPLRLSPSQEMKGLDIAEHGEIAYEYLHKKHDIENSVNQKVDGYFALPHTEEDEHFA